MTQVYLTQCGSFTATHGHGSTLNEAPHPHTFTYEITFHGPLNDEGYLLDFRAVQDALTRKISTALEDAKLNELFENPTTEILAVWIFNTVKEQFPQLCRVKLAEEKDRWITYEGEE